jgi:hypothetical protein
MELNILLLFAQAAGALLVVGMLSLLWKGRVYLDAKGEPISFEFPVIGKIKTQSPVIAMVLIGAGMVLYPISRAAPPPCPGTSRDVTVMTPIDTQEKTVNVYLVAEEWVAESKNTFPIKLTVVPGDAEYTALYEVDRHIWSSEPVSIPAGVTKVSMKGFTWGQTNLSQAEARLSSNTIQPADVREVTGDEIKKFNIK